MLSQLDALELVAQKEPEYARKSAMELIVDFADRNGYKITNGKKEVRKATIAFFRQMNGVKELNAQQIKQMEKILNLK